MFETPVLFIIFNRPDTTEKVFEKIKSIKPQKLYIAADGPRKEKENEIDLCQKARDIVQNGIDWNCDVQFKFENSNLGCGLGVYSAITWAFKKEERLIILEDDVVPANPFFKYCEDLLETYRDDPRVWVISGLNHFNGKKNLNNDSYFFSHYASINGWATWKRCWDQYDIFMKSWPEFKKTGLKFSHVSDKEGVNRMNRLNWIYENKIQKGNKIDAWGPQYSFPIWANSGVGIVPAENLITNIGVMGTHSSTALRIHNLQASETFKIDKRPNYFQINHVFDKAYFETFIKKNYRQSLIKKFKKMFKKTLTTPNNAHNQ